MKNLKGYLSNFWKEKHQVKIDGKWYTLGNHIKPQFVKQNTNVSFNTADDNDSLITFIKAESGFQGNNPQTKSPEEVNQNQQTMTTDKRQPEQKSKYDKDNEERQKSIVNQFCVREGLKALEVYNQNVKEEDVIKPSYEAIRNQATLIKGILEDLAKLDDNNNSKVGRDLPDY